MLENLYVINEIILNAYIIGASSYEVYAFFLFLNYILIAAMRSLLTKVGIYFTAIITRLGECNFATRIAT
jgi:hypothetical protein